MESELDRARAHLGPGSRLVLMVHALFVFASSLSNIFVSIFLWKVRHSLALLGWFHLYQFLALAVAYLIAGRWAELRELGILLGSGAGFYWLGNHVLTFDLTRDENRERFNGLFSFFASISWMTAPLVAAFIIEALPDLRGYRIIFLVSFILFVASAVVSFFLWQRTSTDPAFSLMETLIPRSNPHWNDIMIIHGFYGVRNGVFVFLISIFLFSTTGREWSLGTFSLATGSATLVASYGMARFIKRPMRRPAMAIGLAAVTLSVLFLAIPGVVGLWLFGVSEAIFLPIYSVPFGAVNYRVLERDPKAPERRVEYMVARELPLNAGRIAGIGAFLALVPWLENSHSQMLAFVLVLGLVPALAWPFLRRLPAQ